MDHQPGTYDHVRCGTCGHPRSEHPAECPRYGYAVLPDILYVTDASGTNRLTKGVGKSGEPEWTNRPAPAAVADIPVLQPASDPFPSLASDELLSSEVDQLRSELARVTAERDAVIRACIRENSHFKSYDVFTGIVVGRDLPTYEDAVSVVRRAAGLAQLRVNSDG